MRPTLLVLASLAVTACRPAPPPAPAPPGVGPPLVPGPGLAPLTRAGLPERERVCGAPLLAAEALPDPEHLPDRDGEWLRLMNPSPEAVPLDGWTLRTGRRDLALDGLLAPAGGDLVLGGPRARRPLGSLRLRNSGGHVDLVDPCGLRVSRLSWGEDGCGDADPGVRVARGEPWPGKSEGPARRVPGGAPGGCGQI